MDKILWIALAFVAGAFLPVQGGLNTKLGQAIASPIHATLVSFIVGTVALVLYLIVSRQDVVWSGLKTAPAYAWGGGLLGACYLTVIILAYPRLGPGLTFGLVVAGQMMASAVLEHFNILVVQPQPINLMRLLGIALVIAGVVVLRRF